MRVFVLALVAALSLAACNSSSTFTDIIKGVKLACGITLLTDVAKSLLSSFPSVQAAIDAACSAVGNASSAKSLMATDPTAVRNFGPVTAPDGTVIDIIGTPVKKQ